MSKTVLCPQCGEEYTIGQWPHCPHGRMATYRPFEAYLDQNIADRPVEISSDRQREKLMRQNNLVVREREHVDDLNQRRSKIGLPPVKE